MRIFAALITMIVSLAACAQDAPATYVEGQHYITLSSPVRTADKNKVEVTELFWYGCGHCFKFEPLAQQWESKAPEYVSFVQSPAMWNGLMELHARAFYAAKALNVFDKVHQPLFNKMNLERDMLKSPEAIFPIFAAAGVNREDFDKAFNSFSVSSQVKQANARARGYKITGTPSMVVDGRYRVSTREAGGHVQMLKIVDFLVEKVRAERG
jgi:thiol:disulfide interchange protein DsbA